MGLGRDHGSASIERGANAMKILAIVGALLVTGGALYLVVGQGAEQPDTESRIEPKGPGRSASEPLDERGSSSARGEGSLEERVARLEQEVASLRHTVAVRGRVAVSGSAAQSSITDDPELEEEVRGIYEQEREREREREMEVRRDRVEEIHGAALDELVEVASLDEEERQGIDGLWSTELDRMLPLFAAMRSGDRGVMEIREELQAIRKETDDAARALLSDDEFESYEELRPQGPRGGRPRGRSGPPRGEG